MHAVTEHGGYVGYDFSEDLSGRFREWCASLHVSFATPDMYVEIAAANMASSERETLFDRFRRRGSIKAIAVHDADNEILKAIGETLDNVEELHFDGFAVTDDGLAYLRRCTRLKSLYLDNTSVSGLGFSRLHDMSELEVLEVTSSKMTDSGVAELIYFPKLWWVNLESNNQLTNVSERHLGKMKSLTFIDLRGSTVVDCMTTDLWTLLPKLQNLNGFCRPSESSNMRRQ